MKMIKSLMLMLIVSTGVLFALPSKTVYSDCPGGGKSSKTYHDTNNSGEYDHITTRDCDGKVETKPLGVGQIIIYNPYDYNHELIEFLEDTSGNRRIKWHLEDEFGVLKYIEFKDYTDCCFTIIEL